jgi:hypothetical protein
MEDPIKFFRTRVSSGRNSITNQLDLNTEKRLKAEASNATAQAQLIDASAELSQAIMVNGFAHQVGQKIQKKTEQIVGGWLS